MLRDSNSGKLARVRDECDAVFGRNRQMGNAAGTAAALQGANRARVELLSNFIYVIKTRRHLRRRLEHFRARLPCPGPIPGHPVPSEARRARGRGAGPITALAS